MKKKLTALFLAMLMCLSLFACTGNNEEGSTSLANTDPLTKDDVIEAILISNGSWPNNENWKIYEYIREGIGATINFISIPNVEAGTKYSVMFADPASLPDLMTAEGKIFGDEHSVDGSAIALDDVAEYMPNYTKWVSSLSDEDYANLIQVRKSADGKVYYTPLAGRDTTQGVMAWIYRKDIFEKHGLETPKTFDELYEVAKELKAIYPNSYPLCMRMGIGFNLTVLAPSFDKNWTGNSFYYDEDAQKWKFGAIEPAMKEYLEFCLKMLDEDLLNPNFATISTQDWQELISTDRGFMTPEYQSRIDFFNSSAKDAGSPLRFAGMVPPVANAEKGVDCVIRNSIDPYGYIICNTLDDNRIANSAKYLDWFYADDSIELVSWGKEGETFEVVDGKKQYITNGSNDPISALYGFSSAGTFLRTDREAMEATLSEDVAESREMVLDHRTEKNNVANYLAFNQEEQNVFLEKKVAITTYTDEILTKILLGQLPLSAYDEIEQNVIDMGLEEVLAAYESAHARIK